MQHSTHGGQQHPIPAAKLRRTALTAQHPQLMSEHQDLQLLGAAVTVTAVEQMREGSHHEEQDEQHRWQSSGRPVRRESGFRTPTGGSLYERLRPIDRQRDEVNRRIRSSASESARLRKAKLWPSMSASRRPHHRLPGAGAHRRLADLNLQATGESVSSTTI